MAVTAFINLPASEAFLANFFYLCNVHFKSQNKVVFKDKSQMLEEKRFSKEGKNLSFPFKNENSEL